MKIATLCGMGFGTSMMVKMSLQDLLDEQGIRADIEPWDLSSYRGQQADIIVAPADMKRHLQDASARVVLLDNLTDQEEMRSKVLPAVHEQLGS